MMWATLFPRSTWRALGGRWSPSLQGPGRVQRPEAAAAACVHVARSCSILPPRAFLHACFACCRRAGYLAVPRGWSASSLLTFMLCIGPTSSIFDVTTFALLWWVGSGQLPHEAWMVGWLGAGQGGPL